MKNQHSFTNKIRKAIASFFVTLTVLSPAALGGAAISAVALAAPQAASAQVTILGSVPDEKAGILELLRYSLVTAAKIGWKNAVRAFLERIAYNTAVWLASGAPNQRSLSPLQAIGEQLLFATDAALGEFLNGIAGYNGLVNLNICDLGSIDKLKINLILPSILAEEPKQCSFTEAIGADITTDEAEKTAYSKLGDSETWTNADLVKDITKFYNRFADDPSQFVLLSAKLDDGENALSGLLIALDKAIGAQTTAKEEAILERLPSSFNDVKSSISGRVETHEEIVKAQIWASIFRASEAELAFTDNPVADAVSVFYTTLSSKLLERFTTGLLAHLTEADIEDSLSGSSSTSLTGSSGREAAEERFATFRTASFTTGVEGVDVLTEFAACPDEGATTTNCVINEQFRLAIEEGMTLNEAFDQGIIDRSFAFGVKAADGTEINSPSQGMALRNIEILRAYDVVPVGWELAAQYIRDFETGEYSIGEVTDGFDNCGEGADYSPFCGLVDPDWVLKEPLVYCKYQSNSDSLLFESFEDTDANPYTPSENIVSRASSCIDPQTCIDEDDSGFCHAYGYCTEQRDIYRFQGTECPMQYSSCEGFTDVEGSEVHYLQNTLNFNDCNTDNVGCQWYCGVYNTVDEQFQCAGENEIYTTCTTDGGCSCTGSDGATCTIENGGFVCTTDPDGDGDTSDGVSCTTGTQSESGSDLYSITLDSDAQACDDEANGCTEFVQVKGGNNLLSNSSFESYSYGGTDYSLPSAAAGTGLVDSTDTSSTGYGAFTFGFEKDAGTGCVSSTSTTEHTCQGWEFFNGMESVVRGTTSPSALGSAALQVQAASGTASEFMIHRFDTGQNLENRSFALSFYATPDADDCTLNYWLIANDGSTPTLPSSPTGTISLNDADSNAEYTADTYTFADGEANEIIGVAFSRPSGCDVLLDAVKLEENRASSGFDDYQSEPVNVNVNTANSCTEGEIGCELFTPVTGESETAIAGQITNPLSEACGDGDNYTGGQCSQCTADFVGCDAYIQEPTPYDVPLKDAGLFTSTASFIADTPLTEAMASRSGYYCSDDQVACNPDLGCGVTIGTVTTPGSGDCLPSISVIPSTGTQCSAAFVGCEEYVNIDESGEGGERLEYYTFVQQCVKPTERQNDAGEIETYFTWEGSDETGFQLRSWELKVSTVDTDEDGDGNSAAGPCTNLDKWDYTGTAETPEAKCIDDTLGVDSCQSVYGDDPACLEFRDRDGNAFYRYKTDIIMVSDDCIGLQNTADERIYYSLQSESVSCPSDANQCREYKGSQGSNVRIILEDDFETATFDSSGWSGGSASGETITAGVSLVSLLIGTDTGLASGITNIAQYNVSGQLREEDSYVVTFWAKADGGTLDSIDVSLYSSDSSGTTTEFGSADLTEDWQQYTLGPLSFAEGTFVGDEVLQFVYNGSGAYIDYVQLQRSTSHYLVVDTADLCGGYEGCEQYKDTDNSDHYLKSFTGLCSEQAVGCEALIDTEDSNNPYYDVYNDSNEFTEDDVAVAADSIQYYTVTGDSLCSAEESACTVFGEPDLDARFEVESFETTYFINDPDSYDTILCEQQSLQCSEFTSLDGNTVKYFKSPGDKTCSYNTSLGYWVIDGDADNTECPVQYGDPTSEGAQPLGAVCNGGERSGLMCSHDDDCPAADGDTGTYRCVSDASYYSGWVGSCQSSYAGCTMYVDPNTRSLVENQSFEADAEDNDGGFSEEDGLPDEWELLDEGESNPSGGTTNGYVYRDVTGMSVSTNAADDELGILIMSESDYTSGVSSYFYLAGTTSDVATGNPSSQDEMVAVVWKLADEISDDFEVVITTTNDAGEEDTVRFTIPASALNASTNDWFAFYVSETGALYWGDTDQNGEAISYGGSGASYMSRADAFARTPLTDPTSTIINAFYDALGSTEVIGCETFERSNEQSFEQRYSVKLSAGSTYGHCMIMSDDDYRIDPDELNTVRANIYTPDSDAEFAVGLLYYYETGSSIVELPTSAEPEGQAFAAFEGGDRSANAVIEDEWVHYHGTVGPNLKYDIPSSVIYARPFIEVSNGTIYVDEIRLSENEKYSYLAETVDGDSDSSINTCSGEVNAENGCVAFRDASFFGTAGDPDATDMTYLSVNDEQVVVNSEYTIESCSFNDTDETEACASYPNAADTNVVLKIRRDRECSEWLACKKAQVTEFDEEGIATAVECSQLGRCAELAEDGSCGKWITDVSEENLDYDSDISIQSQPGNTIDLKKIEYLSGYSSAGIEWLGVADDSTGTCLYGAYHGLPSAENDCTEANIAYGYYPYDWMIEQGSSTADAVEDIIEDGDFEGLYCNGDPVYDIGNPPTDLSEDADYASVLRSRDKRLTCTLDYHCRTLTTDANMETAMADGNDDLIASVPYHEGWCENVDAGEWNDWAADSTADMYVIDFDSDLTYSTAQDFETEFGYSLGTEESIGANVGAGGLDLNNVLFVDPEDYNQESGIVYEGLDAQIQNGGEYTVSFDAQYAQAAGTNDYIQVGFVHTAEDGTQSYDYFTTGIPTIDIVFVVDNSGSMSSYIAEVADKISAFAEDLQGSIEEDLTIRYGIVVTGGSSTSGPYPLDFSDYSASSSDPTYGGLNGVTEAFTEDTATLTNALNWIAGHVIGGQEFSYEALASLVTGFDSTGISGYEMPFNTGADKFVVLVTDEPPENNDPYLAAYGTSNYDGEEEEEAFLAELLDLGGGPQYKLYSFLRDDLIGTETYTAASAFDAITSALGGQTYDISEPDYSEAMSLIAADIVDSADPFRFTSDSYLTYTLDLVHGVIENKSSVTDETDLFIRQTATSQGTNFVIDNVSLKPLLEVNKENNPSRDHSEWLIARQCRAYPEDSSLSCNYTDSDGVIYNGFKGYCLLTDKWNSDRCVQWWPIELLSGESSISNARSEVEYSGEAPLYHCLVAKGNEAVGACSDPDEDDHGKFCSADSQCNSGDCLGVDSGNEFTTEHDINPDDPTDVDREVDHTYTSDNYQVAHEIDNILIDSNSHDDSDLSGSNEENAFFMKFEEEDLLVEQNIHFSEIENIRIDMGEPTTTNNSGSSGDEVHNPDAADAAWQFGTDYIETRNLENTDSGYPLWKYSSERGYANDEAANSALLSSGEAEAEVEAASYASQRGVWCEDDGDDAASGENGLCDADSDEEQYYNSDLVWVKAVTTAADDQNIFISGRVGNNGNPFSPFHHNDYAPKTSEMWEYGGIADQIGGNAELSKSVRRTTEDGVAYTVIEPYDLNARYFWNRHSEDDGEDRDAEDSSGCWGNEICGANIFGINLDFEDGYLQDVYVFYWNGFRRFDVNKFDNLKWTFYLKEPCLVMVESVSEDVDVKPWMTRATNLSDYQIPTLGYTARMSLYGESSTRYSMFGAMEPDSNSSPPNETDGEGHEFSGDTRIDYYALADENLPLISLTGDEIGNALPFACIGRCTDARCQEDYSKYDDTTGECTTQEGEASGTTGDGKWVGVHGLCSAGGEPILNNNQVVMCGGDSDCDDFEGYSDSDTTCDPISGLDNQGILFDTYDEQLASAFASAWVRYRQLFANPQRSVYIADASESAFGSYRNQPSLSLATGGSLLFSDQYDDFANMPECSTDERTTTDYCAYRPTVSNIRINDDDSGDVIIETGEEIDLYFDMDADPDQEPIRNIRIIWESDSEVVSDDGLDTAPYKAFDEECAEQNCSDSWNAASEDNVQYQYVYACNPSDAAIVETIEGETACKYRLRIQVEDNWAWCSGENDIGDTRGAHGSYGDDGDDCTSYDMYDGYIYVKAD